MKLLHQISSGGVVFKNSAGRIQICLIARRNARKRLVWCLPKGHVEGKETLKKTALREVREETGVLGTICAPLGSIRYQFYDAPSKQRISKRVHFFLIQYVKGNITHHDDEVEKTGWHSLPKALRLIQYPSESRVLRKAVQKIESRHGKSKPV